METVEVMDGEIVEIAMMMASWALAFGDVALNVVLQFTCARETGVVGDSGGVRAEASALRTTRDLSQKRVLGWQNKEFVVRESSCECAA